MLCHPCQVDNVTNNGRVPCNQKNYCFKVKNPQFYPQFYGFGFSPFQCYDLSKFNLGLEHVNSFKSH